MDEKAIQNLIDRQAILDCMTRYCRGVDRRDHDLIRSVYHPDAIDDHGAFVGSREAFIEWGRLGATAGFHRKIPPDWQGDLTYLRHI